MHPVMLPQRPVSHCCVCQHKSGAEEREEAGRVSRMKTEAKALKERTRDLEKQVETELKVCVCVCMHTHACTRPMSGLCRWCRLVVGGT